MIKSDIEHLYYIVHIENCMSILKHGIFSYKLAKKINHITVADKDVQKRRSKVVVPNKLPLHEYVNLYFCARNPMLYRIVQNTDKACVLYINKDILNLKDVVITDGNASSNYTAFYKYPDGLVKINSDIIFSTYWTSDDPIEHMKRVRIKCAEVLIPKNLEPDNIFGAYVPSEESKLYLNNLGFNKEIKVYSNLFFR